MMSWKKFLILASSFFSFYIFSGVCATLTVLKPTSILFVLPMGNLMIMHVKSKRHHARNRRKLKSCLWVDVKVTLITKLISKNVFNFCAGRGKKKKKNQGWLLLWELLRFHYAAAVYTVEHRLWEVRGRALCDADAVRWEGGSTPNPAQSSSRGCPALHWALHQSPLPCPQQLAQSSVCQEQKEQGSGNAPQIDFATQGGCSGAALSGAAWGSLGRFSKEVLPNTGLGLVLQVTLPGPIDAQEAWKEVFQWWLEALYFSINTMLLCAHLLGYYITHNPWADFKNPIFL